MVVVGTLLFIFSSKLLHSHIQGCWSRLQISTAHIWLLKPSGLSSQGLRWFLSRYSSSFIVRFRLWGLQEQVGGWGKWLSGQSEDPSLSQNPQETGTVTCICNSCIPTLRYDIEIEESLEAPQPTSPAWEVVNKGSFSNKVERKDRHLRFFPKFYTCTMA